MQLLRKLHGPGLRLLLQLRLTPRTDAYGGQAVPSVGTWASTRKC